MDQLLKQFPHAYVRDYKGGKEIRVKDLDHAVEKARALIKNLSLPVEIFNIDSSLRSFSVKSI